MTPAELEHYIGTAPDDRIMSGLSAFAALIEKWNPRINLVSKASLSDLWHRHIADSAQIYRYAPVGQRLWVDFGSGGGFPGVVLAILSQQIAPETRHVLVESDQRKSAFLREATRALGLSVKVISERIESVSSLGADVVTARALAPLIDLFPLIAPHLAPDGVGLLPKGSQALNELDLAATRWHFDFETFTSLTDTGAHILRVRNLRPRNEGLEPR